jgi:ABC-type branched-subunit amino acid transport system substrate-binding protein
MRFRRAKALVVATAVVVAVAAVGVPSASGGSSVRGFDGKTLKTGGLGLASNFGGNDIGTKARFKRANDTNELKGITLEYVGFADDKADPATALSEARRLVTQEEVFAIVPDLSPVNPGEYLNAEHVPYVGWAFDKTYCSKPKPSTKLYGFGYSGCLVPDQPPYVSDNYAGLYSYVSGKTGKKSPTVASFSNDNESGKLSTEQQSVGLEGAGFDVVYKKANVPMTTSDYTPYVQELLSSADGKQPDVINCLVTTQCIPMWEALDAAGFEGTFFHPVFTDILVKPLAGTVSRAAYNTSGPEFEKMRADFDAVDEDSSISSGSAAAYFAADMFIEAVKQVLKQGGKQKLTPEAVQKVLSRMTWEIPGLAGPVEYPKATVVSYPTCSTLLESDGTKWTQISEYSCSRVQHKTGG